MAGRLLAMELPYKHKLQQGSNNGITRSVMSTAGVRMSAAHDNRTHVTSMAILKTHWCNS